MNLPEATAGTRPRHQRWSRAQSRKLLPTLGLLAMLACSSHIAAEPTQLPATPLILDANRSCGPMCVAFLDKSFGGTKTYEEIALLCVPGPKGSSLEQLRAALEKLGRSTLGFTAQGDALRCLRAPAILHLMRGDESEHFLVCLRWNETANTYTVFDPPSTMTDRPAADVEASFTGTGLAVSDRSLTSLDDVFSVPASAPWHWPLRVGMGLLVAAVALRAARTWRRAARPRQMAPATATGLLLVSVMAGCGRTPQPLHAAAQKVIAHKVSADGRTVHVGELPQGEPIKTELMVVNNSDRHFKIVHVEKSCGCQTVAVENEGLVLAHSTAAVQVEIPTSGAAGELSKKFIVHTDAEDERFKRIEYTVEAQVSVALQAIPTEVHIGNLLSTSGVVKRFEVQSVWPDLRQKFKKASSNNSLIDVQMVGERPGALDFEIKLADGMPSGDIWGQVDIEFDDPVFDRVTVRVTGRRVGDVAVIPARIQRENLMAASGGRQKLRLNSRSGRALVVRDVQAPAGLRVEWDPASQAGPTAFLTLAAEKPTVDDQANAPAESSSAAEPANGQIEYVIVQLQHPDEPEVRIPVLSAR